MHSNLARLKNIQPHRILKVGVGNSFEACAKQKTHQILWEAREGSRERGGSVGNKPGVRQAWYPN